MTTQQIADELGFKSARAAAYAIRGALERRAKIMHRDGEILAQLEEERLSKAERALWRSFQDGDFDATKLVDAVTKLHDKRVNLHGIGAKFEVEADKAEALAILSSALTRAIVASGIDDETQDYLLKQIAGELGAGDEE